MRVTRKGLAGVTRYACGGVLPPPERGTGAVLTSRVRRVAQSERTRERVEKPKDRACSKRQQNSRVRRISGIVSASPERSSKVVGQAAKAASPARPRVRPASGPAKGDSARGTDMMSFERTSMEARGDTGERIPQDSAKLSEGVGEGHHDQETRPIRDLRVEHLRQSIAAGNYLTSVKIDATVERLCRELARNNTLSEKPRRQLLRFSRHGPPSRP